MSKRIDGSRAAQQIAARLSLRGPQRDSLDILANLLETLELTKDADLQHWLKTIRAQYPTVEKFERDFPTLCFALATGVGKTRLMGAIIAWLFITGRSRHFFVLAPNLTIYEKLKQDFLPGSPKYVFKGITELADNPPVLITGEDYEDGRGVRLDIAVPQNVTGELFTNDTAPHINIFNISKINARDNKKGAAKSSMARVRRYQEYLGESYFDYLAGLLGQCGAAGEALDQLADLLVAQRPRQREHLGEAAQFQGHGRGCHGRLAEVGLHLAAGVVELHPELRALGAADARPVAEALQQAVVLQHHAAGASSTLMVMSSRPSRTMT